MSGMPRVPALGAATERRLLTPEFWRSVAPELATSQRLDLGAVAHYAPSTEQGERLERSMRQDGFCELLSVLPAERVQRMRSGIEAVRARFGHEVFALMFDEPWLSLAEVVRVLEPILGAGLRAVPLPYVNYVPPGDAGFAPHRDRHGAPLDAQGLPNMVTAWFSLTETSPERACLSVLPARFDPGFPDHLEQREVPDLRNVRALPVSAGSLLCFNQSLLHWGGRNFSDETRVSFAFEVEREGLFDARQPAIELASELDFEWRCGFVGATIGMLSKSNLQFSPSDLDAAQLMCEHVHGAAFNAYFTDES